MSTIAENLQRIINAKAAIKAAIEAKGGVVSDDAKLSDFSNYIENISSSEETPLQEYYRKYANNELGSDIVVPNGVTKLSNYAFYGQIFKNVNSIKLPSTIESIGDNTFYSSSVKVVDMSECSNVTELRYCNFQQCQSLTYAYLPSSLTYIGQDCFNNCRYLNNVTLSYGLETIRNNAFRGCSAMTEINIPDTVTYIGDSCFYNCSKLTYLHLSENLKELYGGTISNGTALTSVSVPASVTYMQTNAIYGQINLETVIMNPPFPPDGGQQFSNCSKLTNIYVPVGSEDLYKTNTYWSTYANKIRPIYTVDTYIGMTTYSPIVVDWTDTQVKIKSDLVINGTNNITNEQVNNEHITYYTKYNLPDVNIGDSNNEYSTEVSFNNFSNTVDIIQTPMPANVFVIEYSTNYSSTAIGASNYKGGTFTGKYTIFEFEDDLIEIPAQLMYTRCCYGKLILPSKLTSIKTSAFYYNYFDTVIIPKLVTEIGFTAFNNNSYLRTVYIYATTPPTLGYNALPSGITKIYVPDESVELYKAASGWSNYASKIVGLSTLS